MDWGSGAGGVILFGIGAVFASGGFAPIRTSSTADGTVNAGASTIFGVSEACGGLGALMIFAAP